MRSIRAVLALPIYFSSSARIETRFVFVQDELDLTTNFLARQSRRRSYRYMEGVWYVQQICFSDQLRPLVGPLRMTVEETLGASGRTAHLPSIIIAGLTTGNDEQRENTIYAVTDLAHRRVRHVPLHRPGSAHLCNPSGELSGWCQDRDPAGA
ncbi:hypothetical protein HD554DRAFT_1008727 [Boletus coccyginus]|nr:hypothetical protein HD554DRAFT_1008727 [Boletus coccyginus]